MQTLLNIQSLMSLQDIFQAPKNVLLLWFATEKDWETLC